MLYMKGDGTVVEHVGSYEELFAKYIEPELKKQTIRKTPENKESESAKAVKAPGGKARLSYNERRLYEILPDEISKLEQEIKIIEQDLSDPELFCRDEKKFYDLSSNLERIKREKEEKENKWLEIEEKISLL